MTKVLKKNNLVVVVREYEKDGETKKVWKTIGELTTFEADDGKTFSKAELYHMPGVSISVFAQDDKPKQENKVSENVNQADTEDINPDDIPF